MFSSSECASVIMSSHVSIAKLYSLGVEPTIVNWIVDFLRDRQQRVMLNGTRSSWVHVPAGCSKGTRIAPWLFVVMINDLQLLSDESFHIWKFADDTTVSQIVLPSCPSSLQQGVEEISSWSWENHLQLNHSKCKELRTCFKKSPRCYPHIISLGLEFEQVSTAKILGATLRQDFKWNDHIDNISANAAKRLYLLWELKRAGVSCNYLVLFYCSAIKSVLESSWVIFHRKLPRNLSEDLERIQKRAVRIMLPDYKHRDTLKIANIDTLYDRRESLSLKLFLWDLTYKWS